MTIEPDSNTVYALHLTELFRQAALRASLPTATATEVKEYRDAKAAAAAAWATIHEETRHELSAKETTARLTDIGDQMRAKGWQGVPPISALPSPTPVNQAPLEALLVEYDEATAQAEKIDEWDAVWLIEDRLKAMGHNPG